VIEPFTVDLDADEKQRFVEIADSVGLDAPTVVRMLVRQTIRDRAIPLTLSAPDNSTMQFMDAARADWGEW